MRKILLVLAGCGLAAACTASPAPAPPAAPVPPPPAPPPAACLLDVAALAAGTGVTWTPDEVIAGDTRCVYDATGGAFLVVDLAVTADPDADPDVETPAALCDEGTRTTLEGGGWTCRFGQGVFGATAVAGRLVTLAAATVPPGTDADRLLAVVGAELDRLTGP